MKALVTGATGFIGSAVVRALLAEGREVKALKRADSDTRNLRGLDVEYAEGDLLDPDSLDRAMKGCNELYQVAAIYRHWHPKGGDFIRKTNIQGTENILEAALKHEPELVVYTSSISSLGFYKDRLSTEDDYPEEKDCRRQPYRQSKLISERNAKQYADKLPLVIVNPSSPIGRGDYVPTPTGRVILDFLNGKMYAYVDVGFNLIDVDDLAKGFVLAGKHGKRGERYILGNKNAYLKDFLELLGELTGIEPPKKKVPKPLLRVVAEANQLIADLTKVPPVAAVEQALHTHYNEFADCSKARNELGLPANDIKIGARKAIDYYLETGAVEASRKEMIKLED